MTATLTISDETATGQRLNTLTLEFLTARITVRELIRKRVYEEVREYNLGASDHFRGLVQPTGAERTLNGYRLRERRQIDWEAQADRAVAAFQRNGFFILVDDRQAEDLDQAIELRAETQVSFVKLLPLVGG